MTEIYLPFLSAYYGLTTVCSVGHGGAVQEDDKQRGRGGRLPENGHERRQGAGGERDRALRALGYSRAMHDCDLYIRCYV